ncbi:MAG: hypothetical protein HYS21_11615 [Deltaproteobacteria bacterium]|nr:hypothetical protein [Deltaproteobacteria bacterium]
MKHTYNIKMRMALWAAVGIICFASAPATAGEPAWWTQQKRDCGLPSNLAYNDWDGKCNSTTGITSAPGYDYEAARRAQEAAAAAERQRQQEEADRIEREHQAEIKRQADFIRDRDAAAKTLKGSSGQAMDQLKGLSGTDSSGLKGSGFDTGNTGLKGLRGSDNADQKARSQPASHTDASVVDARNVPTGLQKTLENAIAIAYSSAPPGVSDRVRKGFQAVMERDWKVAKAWFEDALKLDPNNVGLKRLVALADISQQPNKQSATVDERNEPAGLGGKSDMKGSSAQPSKTKPAQTAGQLQLPDPNDIYLLFPGLEATTDPNLQLPTPDDIDYLFPGLKEMDDKAAQDYLFGLDPYPAASKSGKIKSKSERKEGILDRTKRAVKETREKDPQTKEKLKRMPKHGDSVGGKPAADEINFGGKN